MNIKIGTRKSPLALVQAHQVAAALSAAHPALKTELVEFITSGDKFMTPLTDIGGKGLFTKEIEEALLDETIDMAVHSMKDMPTLLPKGLIIGAMPKREDPRDMMISTASYSLENLPHGITFGTSSLRRSAQLRLIRPDLDIIPFRGNVQTRLKKLKQGEVAGTMLAKAGLNRLGLDNVPGVVLEPEEFLPAIAQGAIGIECRENDAKILELLTVLSHKNTEIEVSCERSFLRELDGSCHTPIAGYAKITAEKIHLRGLIIKPDGSDSHAIEMHADIVDALKLGEEAGRQLKHRAGAGFIYS